jgi:hypothetical protein
VTEGLTLAIGVPIVVSLIMAVILVEGVVEIAVEPKELGHNTEVYRHLSVIVAVVVVAGTDRVKSLVQVGVDDLVAQVVVWLLPEVLWEV